MWTARLLLLAVGCAAFHLQESTPEPTFQDVVEATSVIPENSFAAQAALRTQRLKVLEEALRREFFRLSYADIKQFIPDKIIEFFENKSITAFGEAAANIQKKHPEYNANQVFEVAFTAGFAHLNYLDKKFAKRVRDYIEWIGKRFEKLKPENKMRTYLWFEGWFAAMKKADGRATEIDLELLKAAREERPFINEAVMADWAILFPKLEVFSKNRLYYILQRYCEEYQRSQPLFQYEN